MRQFRDHYVKPFGLVHMGAWVCTYFPHRVDNAPDMPGNGAYVYRPSRIALDGPKAGKPVLGKYDPMGTASQPRLTVGGKVYYSVNNGFANTRYHVAPADRCRIVGIGLRKANLQKPDGRIWVVDTETSETERYGTATPMHASVGVRGGFYCTPLGCDPANVRYTYDEVKVQIKPVDRQPVIAKGEGDAGGMTAMVTREDQSLEFVRCPGRNQTYASWHYDFITVPPSTYASDFDFSPDRSVMALAVYELYGPSRLHLYRLGKKTSEQIDANSFILDRVLDVPARLVSFSPDGLTLACLGADYKPSWPLPLAGYDTTLTLIDLEV